jgi:hypothetical protein
MALPGFGDEIASKRVRRSAGPVGTSSRPQITQLTANFWRASHPDCHKPQLFYAASDPKFQACLRLFFAAQAPIASNLSLARVRGRAGVVMSDRGLVEGRGKKGPANYAGAAGGRSRARRHNYRA